MPVRHALRALMMLYSVYILICLRRFIKIHRDVLVS
jgi:hypothetical protein